MKYFKLFITVFAMAIAMNVSAQSKTTAKAKTTTTTKTTTAAPAKKAAAATKPATTTAAKPAAKPATTTTRTASASKPAASKPAKSSSFSSGDYDPGYHFLTELKLGGFYGTGGWGTNLGLEHEFHKYFAWDIFSVDFSAPFNVDVCTVGLKTGIRGFSPYFWDGKMRAYTSLAVGYDCAIQKSVSYYDPWEDEMVDVGGTSHGFALAWGIGTQIMKHFYIGYDLEYNTNFKTTAHFAKLGWRF